MTAPIPVQQVQIHPQFVPNQNTPGLEMLMTALEHRKQLQMAQKKLEQETQQFELNKRLMGAQTEGVELLNLKRKQELKDAQLDIDARSEALGIVNGHLDVLRDPKPWGEVWARIKDPRVAGFVQQYRDEQLASQQKVATLNATEHPQPHYDIQKTVTPSGQETLTGINSANPRDVVQTGQTPASSAVRLTSQQQIKLGEQAEFGSASLAAWKRIEDIRRASPGVEIEVGRVFTSPTFAKAIPGFHNAQDAVLAMQKSGASQAAQNYIRAKWSFLDNVVRTRYTGARGITGVVLGQLYQEFMPSIDVLSNGQMRQNELQAIATAQGNSGYDEHPEIWNTRAKRHGVGSIDLQSLLGGGSGDTQLDGIHARYPNQP